VNSILVKYYYNIAYISFIYLFLFTNIFFLDLSHNQLNINQKEFDYNIAEDAVNDFFSQSNEFNDNIYKNYIRSKEYNQLELERLSKYSINLQKSLLNNKNKLYDEKVPVIIIFNEDLSRKERLGEIIKLFSNFNIIYEFNIIPGIYLECQSSELLQLKTLIEESNEIIKIFKENIYTIPNNMKIQENSLNPVDWNNWWLQSIGAENLTYDGTGINVSIIDTGIYPHPDFQTRIIKQTNFASKGEETDYSDFIDRNGHGTHVAGIIGGDGEISSGKYRGVAPNVNLMNVKAGNSSGSLKDTDILKAIEWSVESSAQIISMSFGTSYPEVYDPITLAITNATNQGVLCVVSAGNDGPSYYSGGIPATSVNAIAVGSVDKNGNLSIFSSRGPTNTYQYYPSICAPGENIISTEAINSIISNEKKYLGDYINYPGSYDYYPLSGTSMSCPMVSGALALLLQAFPDLNPEAAKIALLKGAYKTNNHETLKIGAGIINISKSINLLHDINSSTKDVNNITTIYPNKLPIQPFDLLNYPGDKQIFNLTVLSGITRNITFQISDQVPDIRIELDKEKINFNSHGVDFLSIYVEILFNATPGVEKITINMSDDITGEIIDQIQIEIEKKIPEFKILYESFHGLNDWFPEYSFKQIDFYRSMKDLSNLNCSPIYFMDKWIPKYNSSLNNSILSSEKLSFYDLIILQNPILPYSQSEVKALKEYFETGGNILFLGARYQEICTENINSLFDQLNVGIQIKGENIENSTHVGIGAILDSNEVKDFLENSSIFKGVSKFYWLTGCMFDVYGNGVSQAELYNSSVVASCDKSDEGKGKFLAFGDLNWLLDEFYDDISYSSDHSMLLQNAIKFLLPEDDLAINLGLKSERVFTNTTSLSVFIKNQTTEMGISNLIIGTSLNTSIENPVTKKDINITLLNLGDGVYYNDSIKLPNFSYENYIISISVKINNEIFEKKIKLLHPNKSKIPEIINYSIEYSSITRESGIYNQIIVNLDKSNINLTAYMGIHPSSFFNSRNTINKTLNFEEESSNKYKYTFIPNIEDTAGYAFFYLIPKSSKNYSNPYSNRLFFNIENNDPIINLTESFYGSYIYFNETIINESLTIQDTFLLTNYNFQIKTGELVDYEDNQDELRVFINFFIVTSSTDGVVSLLFSSNFVFLELSYNTDSKNFLGAFLIPEFINYTSDNGVIQKSVASYSSYYGLFYITVQDSEGGFDTFYILMNISDDRIDPYLIVIILIIIGVIGTIIITFLLLSRKTRDLNKTYEDYYENNYEINNHKFEHDIGLKEFKFCPYCGQKIIINDKICKFCGRDIPEIL